MLAIDIETYDPNLHEKGDGSIRKDGYILCVGVYDGKQGKVYMPDDNNWLEFKERFESSEDKVFHNGVYDLAWLCCGYSLKLNGTIHDTMTRMSLIDEYQELNLDACCKRYRIAGKNKDDTIKNWYAIKYNKDITKVTDNMVWKKPLEIWNDFDGREQMIKYNLQDCKATYDLFYAQEKDMGPYREPYKLECDLYPLLINMKKNGVRIDEEQLYKLRDQIAEDLSQVEKDMYKEYSLTSSIIKSPKQLGEFMHSLGIKSPIKTDKGAESWNGAAFDRIQHPAVEYIKAWKAKNSLLNKYLEGSLANSIINGRIHCTFNPNKREQGGTITGRLSCLATGTLVYTIEHGYIPIEKIKAGYHTVTHTGKIAKIKRLIDNGIRPCYRYENIICTDDHKIWTGKEFKEAKDVNFKILPKRYRAMQKDLRRLLKRAEAFDRRTCRKVRDYCAQYTRSIKAVYNTRTNETRSRIEEEQIKAYWEKCNAWEMWESTSWLQRCYIRWTRQHYDKAQWPLRNVLQKSCSRRNRNRCGQAATGFCSTSYRRKQNEQRFGQSGSMYIEGSSCLAQKISRQTEGFYMGDVRVWDIEVEHEDHSFLANGYFVHNCQNPNLQNIPARDEKHGQKTYGQEMRELFIPEEGCYMAAFDYSQIEYVLMTHYAYGPQAEWAREQTRAGVDFHTMAMKMTGIKERFPVKCINYGILYGMGLDTLKRQNYIAFSELAKKNGQTFDEYCNSIYYTYLQKLPVVKDTMKYIENQAKMMGYVTGIGGRRHHKPKPIFSNGQWFDGIYKITNYLIQGSAAEVLKNALVNAWKQGIFNVLTMHITVHDENVVSVPKTKEGIEAAVALEECMNKSYSDRLTVPIKACGGIGENWGAKHSEEDWQKMRVQYGYKRTD